LGTDPVNARFPRHARLTTPTDYKQVFDNAQRATIGCLTVLSRCNQLGYPRLGLAISKKAAAKAVARNIIKRVARESFRQHRHLLGGIDVVVLAKQGTGKQNRRTLHNLLEKHWAKLSERCKDS
jgi:ribonuclease P protein component